MANELQLYTDPALCTGETIIAKLFENGAQVGTDITMTEVAASGHFNGDMPVVAAATYAVTFYDSSADIVGTGRIVWDGTSEIDPSSLTTAIGTRAPIGEYDTEMGYIPADLCDVPTNPVLTDDVRLDNLAVIASDVAGLDGDIMRGTNYVPTNPLRINDPRLDTLDVAISTRSIAGEYDIVIMDLQTDLTFLHDQVGGKWEIVANQMIFYKEDTSELMRFNLFDVDGNPTMENVIKRERV